MASKRFISYNVPACFRKTNSSWCRWRLSVTCWMYQNSSRTDDLWSYFSFLSFESLLHLITSQCRHAALQHPCEHKDCSSPLIKIWQSGVLHIPYCVSPPKRNSYSYLITMATRGKYWCRHLWPNLLWHSLNLVFDSSLWLKFRFFRRRIYCQRQPLDGTAADTHNTHSQDIMCSLSGAKRQNILKDRWAFTVHSCIFKHVFQNI